MATIESIDFEDCDDISSVVLTAASISALPWEPFGGVSGVWQRVLWRANGSYAGLLRLDADAEIGVHSHRRAHHHVWVVDGGCMMLGKAVTAGAYVHVPAGVGHAVRGVGSDGCTLFYLYLREPE